MSEYENILQQIRPFGPFQVRLFVLVSFFETPLAWAMLVPIFTAANPGFFCSGINLSFNSSLDDDVCERNKTTCPSLSANTEFTSIVTEWHLICDLKYVGELITSLQMVGVGIGAFITGQLADIFGRKKILFAEYTLLIIFWFSTAFAESWQVYAALRVIVGALVGGCLVVNFVLPLEFVTPRWRTFCGCIGFWAVGLMTLALWAYFIRDWRKLNIAMSCSSIVLLALWWLIDESPRWLLIKGHFKEAERIIIKAAHFNKRPVPNCDGLCQFVKKEQFLREDRKKYSYYHLFSSFRLAIGTSICMFGWFVSSAVYYGHNFNSKNLAGNRYLNVFLSGIVEIPALLLVVLINNRLGRRYTSALFMLISGLASFSILIVDLSSQCYS
ncbi:solute carrier family 22 member 15-like [Plakobranchus ocellatus]|uniref:Solute carrier family 22 member 15-like n=1 Tax=Plakobranchus ocellatus TaxID=259542 RepID=A0AAV4DCR9_9GAST|nr:solute carrier family 22 member 15-like [Plakobranchus ocellatus]